MELFNTNEFPRLSNRLIFIDVFNDNLDNIELLHFLSVFEEYVFGVNLQYFRICSSAANLASGSGKKQTASISQLKLDVYYYVLTWDKIKKVFNEKIKPKINSLVRETNNKIFTKDYKQIRDQIEKNLNTSNDSIRNEFEHPTLAPENFSNIIALGNIYQESDGTIKVHIGGKVYAVINKIYLDRLNAHWLKFTDIFIKHFSDKPLSKDLLEIKENIENNIDEIISKNDQQMQDKEFDNKTEIFKQLMYADIFLAKEGINFNKLVKKKIYSMI